MPAHESMHGILDKFLEIFFLFILSFSLTERFLKRLFKKQRQEHLILSYTSNRVFVLYWYVYCQPVCLLVCWSVHCLVVIRLRKHARDCQEFSQYLISLDSTSLILSWTLTTVKWNYLIVLFSENTIIKSSNLRMIMILFSRHNF